MLIKLSNWWNKGWMFPIKSILFIFLTAGVPILAINHYFRLFYRTHDKQLVFTGWGAIAVLIIAIVSIIILSYIIEAFSFRYSFWVKMAKYFKNIGIWLILLLMIVNSIANHIGQFQPVIWWSFMGTLFGAIVNPFPKWVFNQKVEDGSRIARNAISGIHVKLDSNKED